MHDRSRPGESYVLGGEITRLGELIDLVSRRRVRLTIPTAVS